MCSGRTEENTYKQKKSKFRLDIKGKLPTWGQSGVEQVACRGCVVLHPWSFSRSDILSDAALRRLLHCGPPDVLSNLHMIL